jgi:amino acid transporter
MSLAHETALSSEKGPIDAPPRASFSDHAKGRQLSVDVEDRNMIEADQNALHRNLKGRHMQMIAM